MITKKEILASLNGWEADMVSGIELLVHDYDQLDNISQELSSRCRHTPTDWVTRSTPAPSRRLTP